MATYISTSDITDDIINDFGNTIVSAKVELSDDAVESMALSKGVSSGDIETDPVNYLVREWAIAWVCFRICRDYLGKNNLESFDQDKYAVKGKIYFEEMADLDGRITKEVLRGTVNSARDMSGGMTATIYRG